MVRRLRASKLIPAFLAVGLLAAGCSLDTNEPFGYQIRNDLSVTVVLRGCANVQCSNYNGRRVLLPGATTRELGYASRDTESWRVLSATGQPLGCLPFRWSKRLTSDKSFPVSLKVPCGSTTGAEWPTLS
jgi:hypothetical protein